MQAGILLRLSEEKDTASATAEAFERFEAACRGLCERRGWTVARIYHDGVVSAFKGKRRNGFDAAMTDLSAGAIGVLVVSDLDRLLRSWKDAATVDRVIAASGRTVVSSDGRDVAQDPYFAVHVGIAISESKRIGKRVKAQAEQAAAKGRPAPGPRPYGYEPGGMAIRPTEAAVIHETCQRLLMGEPMGAIVADLRRRGITGTAGRLFTTSALRRVLCNPRLAGIRVHRGAEVGSGAWPAIVSLDDHRRVRAIFVGRARQAKGTAPGRARTYAYSGLLVGSCGHRLAGSSGAYRCQQCRGCYIQAAPLEALLGEVFIIRACSPAFASWRAARLEALRQGDTTAADLDRDRAELADLKVTPDRYRAIVDPGGERRATLERRVRQAAARLAAMPQAGALADIPTTEAELRAAWAAWSAEQRHARLAAVLESVTIAPARRRHVFDPSRIEPRWRF